MSSVREQGSPAQPQAFSLPSSFDSEATGQHMQAGSSAAPTPWNCLSIRSSNLA